MAAAGDPFEWWIWPLGAVGGAGLGGLTGWGLHRLVRRQG